MKKVLVSVMLLCALLAGTMNAYASGWTNDARGWRYQGANGEFLSGSWFYDEGYQSWYYFDADTYMAHDKWIGNYYVGSDGAMLKNTVTPDGYRVGPDGAWISGAGGASSTNDPVMNEIVGKLNSVFDWGNSDSFYGNAYYAGNDTIDLVYGINLPSLSREMQILMLNASTRDLKQTLKQYVKVMSKEYGRSFNIRFTTKCGDEVISVDTFTP